MQSVSKATIEPLWKNFRNRNKNVIKFVDNMENKEVKLGDNLKDMVHDFIFPSK